MPRITVTTDASPGVGEPEVLFDEQVTSVHLSTGHAAAQLVERMAWFAPMVTHRRPLREIADAFLKAEQYADGAGKTVIV